MGRRSYRQYCGTAHALDVLGERWTLLIVRDLLLGPLRYSDLREGLSGIATDVLADRLRTLQRVGAVEQVKLAPPAGSVVYRLTPFGEELRPIVHQLGAWGAELLPAAQETEDRIDPGWALDTLAAGYAGGDDEQIVAGFDFDGRRFTLTASGGVARVARGDTPDADVRVSGPTYPLLGVLAGGLPLADDAVRQELTIEGDEGRLAALIRSLPRIPPRRRGGAGQLPQPPDDERIVPEASDLHG